MAKIDSLLSRASEVRDATLEKENTALRVGSLFVDLIQTITAVLPREILEASGISVAAPASDVTISYKKILNDGSAGTGRITIPAVTETGAGVITPALLARIREGLTDISEAIRAADNAQTSADTANTTAANNTALIKQLQGCLEVAAWMVRSIAAGADDPEYIRAKIRRLNLWSSDTAESDIVLARGATEEAAGAMTAQQVKDLKLAKGFMATKGKANGIAPLDSSALVPEKHLPDKVFDVLTFSGIDDSLYDLEAGSAAATPEDANASLVYSSVRDRFVLRVRETVSGGGISTKPPKYYGWFNGAERYGTPDQDGIVPYENKLYLDLYEGGVYYWYDLMLWKPDLDVSIRVDSLENKIGKANGIAPLNASGVVPNGNISDEARKSLFCDLFNAAAGSAGYAKFTNGVWDCKLNGLTLSYDEAVMVFNAYHTGGDHTEDLVHHPVRTNLPIFANWGINLTRFAEYNTSLEVANVNVVFNGNSLPYAFYGCKNLREIRGPIHHQVSKIDDCTFLDCPKLESLDLRELKSNLLLSNSPLFKLDSLDSIVTNADNGTTAITITVHADVYAKLTGDTTNEAAAALTAEELAQWQALLTKAAGKHIAFASA